MEKNIDESLLTLLFDSNYTKLFNGEFILTKTIVEDNKFYNIYSSSGDAIVTAQIKRLIPFYNKDDEIVAYYLVRREDTVIDNVVKHYRLNYSDNQELCTIATHTVPILTSKGNVIASQLRVLKDNRTNPSLLIAIKNIHFKASINNNIIVCWNQIGG